MKDKTAYIVYTLKNKSSIVMFGKKKINNDKFNKAKFLGSLAKKYTFTSSKIDELETKEAAKILYDYKMKHYRRKHGGNLPEYNLKGIIVLNVGDKNKDINRKIKEALKPKKATLKPKKKPIDKNKTHCLISAKNLKIMADKAYKLGYKDAKAGRKKDLSQISLDVWSKK